MKFIGLRYFLECRGIITPVLLLDGVSNHYVNEDTFDMLRQESSSCTHPVDPFGSPGPINNSSKQSLC